MLAALIFELCHPFHLAHTSEAVQNPRQLRMRRNIALTIQKDILIVERQASRSIHTRIVHYCVSQAGKINWRRETMKIRDKHIYLIISRFSFGHINHRQHRPKIIADMQIVIRSYAGKNYILCHIPPVYPSN